MSVYTPVSALEAEALLTHYAIGTLVSIEGITQGIENSNFFVSTTQGDYVLTVFEHHQAHELHYFMALMRHWAAAGLPVACPVEQINGEFLTTVKAKPAAFIRRLPGQHINHASVEHCALMGATTAQMHLVGATFSQPRLPDRGTAWRLQAAQALLPHLSSEQAAFLQQELTFQQQFDLERLPKGTLHADLFRDNVLFKGNQLSGILDCYFACTDSWLYDLAIVVNDWCTEADGSQDLTRVKACVSAYQTIRPWTTLEHDYWLAALRAAALRFWLSRMTAKLNPREGEIAWQKDPGEFRAKLAYLRSLSR